MMKVLLITLGLAAWTVAELIKLDIDHKKGKVYLEPPYTGGPSDTKWELKTCPNCKMVMTCKLNDYNCRRVSIEIWDGVKTWNGCDELRGRALNTSIRHEMSVHIKTKGPKYPALCQVTATKPYIGLSEEVIDSTEHGVETVKDENCRCGWSNKNAGQRIVGGRETKVNEYPFPALIMETEGYFPFCTGSIITEWHILTAAHCTHPNKYTPLSVMVGDHDIMTGSDTKASQLIHVDQIIDHPLYDGRRLTNDISILFLKKQIIFNDKVGPVCMPQSVRDLQSHHVKVMGWGDTSFKGDASDVLRKVNLKIIDPDVCKVIFGTIPEDNTQFCTFANNKDSCQGDSGGPLVWLNPKNRFTQVGVVSYGRECASTDPGVNTNVAAYMDWIKRQISRTKPQPLCY